MRGKGANALQAAMRDSDERLIRSLIREKQVDPAWKLYDPESRFHQVPVFLWAAQKAPLQLIKLVVDLGAQPERILTSNPTLNALCFAALLARLEVVEYFLQQFEKLEKNTALAVVCLTRVRSVKASDYTKVAQTLIAEGADPKAPCALCRGEKGQRSILEAAEAMQGVLEDALRRGDKNVQPSDVRTQETLVKMLKNAAG
jgi:hypothetical protein